MNTLRVDFNQLPRTTQERFIQCTKNAALPVPLWSESLALRRAVGALVFAALALVGLAALVFYEFGRVRDFGLQHPSFIAAYVGLVFCAGYFALAALRGRSLMKSLPFKPGRYLFPMDFVEATSHELDVTPIASITDFRVVHQNTNGTYSHTAFTFVFAGGKSQSMMLFDKALAERAIAGLRAVQYEAQIANEQRDMQKLYNMDVFFDARQNNWQPVAPAIGTIALATRVPALLRRAAISALALSVLVGPALWYLRDMLSDEAAFASIQAVPEYGGARQWVYEVEAYAANGGHRAKTALKKLLPKAEFAVARDDATVTAYRAVAKKHPTHPVALEARAEIAKLYAATILAFHGKAAADPKMRAFMDRLFAYLQANDTPTTLVRFGKPSSSDLEKADAHLNKEIKGGVVPISGHFTAASSAPREQAIVAALTVAFGSSFSADMFHLELGPPLGTGAPPKVPTIEIQYDVKPSGDVFVSEKSKESYVGILMNFDVTMRLPSQADTLSFKLQVAPPDHFTVETDNAFGAYTGTSAGAVYHAMATHAFQQLSAKLRSVFFQ